MFEIGQFSNHSARPLSLDDLYSQLTNDDARLVKDHSQSQHSVVFTAYNSNRDDEHHRERVCHHQSESVNDASIDSAFEDLLNFDHNDDPSNPVNEALSVLSEVDFMFEDSPSHSSKAKADGKYTNVYPSQCVSTAARAPTTTPVRSSVAPSFRSTNIVTMSSPQTQLPPPRVNSTTPRRSTATDRVVSGTADVSPRRRLYRDIRNEQSGLKPRSQSHSDVYRDSLLTNGHSEKSSSHRDLYALRRPLSRPSVSDALSRCDFLRHPVISPPQSHTDDHIDAGKLMHPDFLWSAVKIETNTDGFWSQRTRSCHSNRKDFFFSGDNSKWLKFASKDEKMPQIEHDWEEYLDHKSASPKHSGSDKGSSSDRNATKVTRQNLANQSPPQFYRSQSNNADLYSNKLFLKQSGSPLNEASDTKSTTSQPSSSVSEHREPLTTSRDESGADHVTTDRDMGGANSHVLPVVTNTTMHESPVVVIEKHDSTLIASKQTPSRTSSSSPSSAGYHSMSPVFKPFFDDTPLISPTTTASAPATSTPPSTISSSHNYSFPVSPPVLSTSLRTYTFSPKSLVNDEVDFKNGDVAEHAAKSYSPHSDAIIYPGGARPKVKATPPSAGLSLSSIVAAAPQPTTSTQTTESLQDLLDSLASYDRAESLSKSREVRTPSYRVISTPFVQYNAAGLESGGGASLECKEPTSQANVTKLPSSTGVLPTDLSVTSKLAECPTPTPRVAATSNDDSHSLGQTQSLPAQSAPRAATTQEMSGDPASKGSPDITQECATAPDYMANTCNASNKPYRLDASLDTNREVGSDDQTLEEQLSALENIQTEHGHNFHDILSISGRSDRSRDFETESIKQATQRESLQQEQKNYAYGFMM